MIKYPSTMYYEDFVKDPDRVRLLLQDQITITEKLDGLCLALHNGDVHDRSGNVIDHECVGLVKKHHAWKTKKPDNFDLIVYGEDLYAEHSCQYSPIKESETFRVFRVATKCGSVYGWWSVNKFCKDNGFLTVPLLWKGRVNSIKQLSILIDRLMSSRESMIGGEMEGCVINCASSMSANLFPGHMFKVVRENHVQPDVDHWRKDWKPRDIIWGK